MSDPSNQFNSNMPEATSAPASSETDRATRRDFLKVGAAVVVGLVGAACTDAGGPGSIVGSEGGSNAQGGANQGNGGSNAQQQGNGGSNAQQQGNGGSNAQQQGSGGANNSSATPAGGNTASGGTPGSTAKGGATSASSTTKPEGAAGGKPVGSGGSSGKGGSGNGGTQITGGGRSNAGRGGANPGGASSNPPNTGGGASTNTTPVDGSTWVENRGASCKVGTPASKANKMLPNPFNFLDGTAIAKKEDWACLRADLSAALQASIYGPKMPPPDTLKATYSGGKVTVDMTVGSTKSSFSFSITGGGSSGKAVPCLITCGGSSLSALSGVAKIDMSNNSFSSESDLSGIIKTLFGNNSSKSGALIGWAWGCSRIIDALEQCPDAGIDVHRLAVTGCSRNGKGALAMGAFDERVALTLVQEGGSGGTALWRVSSAEYAKGQKIQEATEIVGEAKWQGSDFKSYVNDVTKLPADQHFAVALCAPRAIMVFENDIDWLGPVATYGGAIAGRKVFEGLGIKDRCGVCITSSHTHCSFPSAEQKYLDAFVNRFLKGQTGDTNVDTFKASNTKLGSFKEADWIDWTVPTLSGSLAWDPFA